MTIDAREQHERQIMRTGGFHRYGPPKVLEAQLPSWDRGRFS